ncbi:MAG: c-type cytochrome [Candidatus Brocadiaceae bacterium]|nr:c-type cytochrome [Candidatus Brocadiaceae bacterium]
MKKVLSFSAIFMATVFGLYLSVPSSMATAGDPKQIYKDTCELCHGPDGKGSEAGKQFGAPDFSNKEYQRTRTDADMKESMTNGTKNANYVPVKDLGVDLADFDGLIALIRTFAE